jgi:hypothetical protein
LRKLAVGRDGVFGGHGEIRRELIEREPPDLAGLTRLTILGAATGYASQISRRNPVLAFVGQKMIANAKKALDRNSYTYFLKGFADGTVVKSFEVFELAADDAPAACFGRALPERKEDMSLTVNNEHTNADSWERDWRGEIVFCDHGWRRKPLLRWGAAQRAPLQIICPRRADPTRAARG